MDLSLWWRGALIFQQCHPFVKWPSLNSKHQAQKEWICPLQWIFMFVAIFIIQNNNTLHDVLMGMIGQIPNSLATFLTESSPRSTTPSLTPNNTMITMMGKRILSYLSRDIKSMNYLTVVSVPYCEGCRHEKQLPLSFFNFNNISILRPWSEVILFLSLSSKHDERKRERGSQDRDNNNNNNGKQTPN